MSEETMRDRSDGGVQAGFWIAAIVIVLLLGIFGTYGAADRVTGKVLSFGLGGSGRGVRSIATARVDGVVATIFLAPSVNCQVGGEVALLRRHNIFGVTYAVALVPNPCRAPSQTLPSDVEA